MIHDLTRPAARTADKAEREAVIATITLGFSADPVARWVWSDAATYLAAMPRFVEAFGGRGFDHDSVYRSECSHAAAMWLPAEIEPDGEAIEAIIASTIEPERLEEIGAFFEQMDVHHPKEPCWYLPMIAAEPAYQGKGLGSALMKHALQRCDKQGLPAYLESSNPRNIGLYERHGFEITGEIQAGASPVMTPMFQAPR
jgi:GNAT superfamily N-acetyltransferase